MFKKRGQANQGGKSSQVKEVLNLNNQLQLLQALDLQKNKLQSSQENKANKQDVKKSEIYQTESEKIQEKNNEEDQFLQKLQRDKKLQNLFQIIQKTDNNQKNASSLNEQSSKEVFTLSKDKKGFSNSIKKKTNVNFSNFSSLSNQNNKARNIEENVNKKAISIQKYRNQKRQEDKEIEDIFKEILEQNKKQQQTQQALYVQAQELNLKNIKKKNQLIIEDDDNQIQNLQKPDFLKNPNLEGQISLLNVQVDFQGNNLSPNVSDHQENEDDFKGNLYQQDFEDQLIRKTLTRTNYTKLLEKSNLKHTKQSQQKQKLFNKILKISWNEIEAKLISDMSSKLSKKNQVYKQMKYLEQRISERQSEVSRKRNTLKQLQEEQKKLKKIIYFLCYFGDQVGADSNESMDIFFSDLTTNIMPKIQKLSDRVNIEEFMQKCNDREKMREKYKKGRKKIKLNEKVDEEGEVIVQEQIMQSDDQEDDGQCFIGDDDY